jgi:hypothetical protein
VVLIIFLYPQIESTEDKTYEFTNIDRDELPALQLYVKGYLEARAAKQQRRQSSSGVIDIASSGGGAAQEGDGSEEESQVHAARDLYETDSSDDDDDDYDPNASDSEGDRKGRRRSGGSRREESEGSDADSGSSSGSDDDDDDDSDSDHGGSAPSAACSGDEEVRQATPTKPKPKATPKARKPAAQKLKVNREGVSLTKTRGTPTKARGTPTKARETPTKARGTPTKSGAKVGAQRAKPKAKPKPGQPVARVLPNIPPVTAATEGLVKAEAGAAGAPKEGRKSVPVKREQGDRPSDPHPAQRPWKHEVMDVTGDPVSLPAAVKQERVSVKQEPVEVVDLEGFKPAVHVKQERSAVDLTTAPLKPPVTVKREPTAVDLTSSSSAPASTGVKRTIMDMFAPLKKKAVIEVGGDDVADLTK